MTFEEPNLLAVGLGANLPSPIGPPISTLIAVRPILQKVIQDWLSQVTGEKTDRDKHSNDLEWCWSSLYETTPIGGPSQQNPYINAVLVVNGERLASVIPCESAARNLLERFLKIEKDFGRDRKTTEIRWGPRSLDLDLLGWGSLQVHQKDLILPHPRLLARSFVIVPLGEALTQKESQPPFIKTKLDWPK